MNTVLIDNWTLHNSASLIDGYTGYTSASMQRLYEDFENVLMAIMLWDTIYYWDNGNSTTWKYSFETKHIPISISPLIIPPEIEKKIHTIKRSDLLQGTTHQYQLIANELCIDYLPEVERFNYLNIMGVGPDIDKINLQQYCVNRIKEDTQEFYQSLLGKIKNAQLKFDFPLLLDYIMSQAGTSDLRVCLDAAFHMREEGTLCSMRSWINTLHSDINNGNWVEVNYALDHVNDIVANIITGRSSNVEVQIGLSPSVSVDLNTKKVFSNQKTQLTFLRNIAKHALKTRPTKK